MITTLGSALVAELAGQVSGPSSARTTPATRPRASTSPSCLVLVDAAPRAGETARSTALCRKVRGASTVGDTAPGLNDRAIRTLARSRAHCPQKATDMRSTTRSEDPT